MNNDCRWNNQKVLVTGGSGFLGSHLCQHLYRFGADVHATSRIPRLHEQNGLSWWQADLTSLNSVRAILSTIRPDVIYHLAGSVGANPDRNLVIPTFQSLLVSTINLLLVGTELGCRRIVLAGSLTEPQDRKPMPTSPYAAAKWASSGYARMFHCLYNTPVVVLVPFMTYGPRQHTDKLIPSVILSILKGQSPRLASGQWRTDWIYVDDVVEGFLAAGHAPDAVGKTLDLGSGAQHSVRSIITLLLQEMGTSIEPVFGVLPDRPMEPLRVADVDYTREVLGWHSFTTLEKGLRQTIDWYATNYHNPHVS